MSETKIYSRPESWMKEVHTHYCPGCGHGIAHRLVCELIDELGIQDKTISMAPVGCAAMMYDYIDIDYVEAPHGRAPAVATGIKRVYPEKVVFTYQGDGDLASIGMAEIIHAANRGENITVIFINNAIYGMTGGQMAPTTLIERVSVARPKYTIKAKEALKKGFQYQMDKKGFSFIEVLSSCPTNWGLTPIKSFEWQLENMVPYYPLGIFKDFE